MAKKLLFGLIGIVVGVMVGLGMGLMWSFSPVIITALIAALFIGIGSAKDSPAKKPNPGLCLLFGFLTAFLVVLLAYYLLPIKVGGMLVGMLGYGLTMTASQILPIDRYLSMTIGISFIIETFIGSSIGFVIAKLSSR